MKLTQIAAGVSASVALFATGAFASVVPQASVQAASKYQVRVSKKAYVYTSKGKKTKKSYKKNAKLTVYGTKTIKGKKYYNLGKGRYIRTSNAKKVFVRYSYSPQTKKITRTIKLYQPTGEKKVIQNAYIKRSVKTDNKTKKKTYGKWSTSSWKKYTVAKVEGYTASRSSVGAAKVTYKRKNQTIKVTYKKNASASNSSSSTSSSSTSKPTNSENSESSKSSESSNSTNTPNKEAGLADHYTLVVNDATITSGANYDSTAFKVKNSTTGNSASSDVIQSVSMDASKVPFPVSIVREYGIYNLKAKPANNMAGTYNLPVTVTFTDASKKAVNIKITVLPSNTWNDTAKANTRVKVLAVFNGFRSIVKSSPVALDTTPEYQKYLDQRATEKAKQRALEGKTDHSGQTLQDKYRVFSAEEIASTVVKSSDALETQVQAMATTQQKGLQAEKDDYEAINIRHERNYLTNPAGTVLHYVNMIDPHVTRSIIGVGTYTTDGNTYIATVTAHVTSNN